MKKTIKRMMYMAWALSGIKIKDYRRDCPLEEKRKFLEETAEKYESNVFIETGTHMGDTLFFLKDRFARLISVELSGEYYAKAVERFKDIPKIQIVQGDSGEKLPEILKNIDEKCLFWLDGHYSFGNTGKGEKETPILKELQAILDHHVKGHVILIDDARLFIGRHDYPWLPRLKKYVDMKSKKSYDMRVEKDIVVITPKK